MARRIGSGEEFVFGINEAIKILEELPNGMTKDIINSAARKSLQPVKRVAKMNLKAISNRTQTKNNAGFSKLLFIHRSINIRPLAKNGFGARVKAHGPDIPMGRKLWNIEGAAKLFSAGSYLTPDRNGTGRFKGFGNYIQDAGATTEGQVKALFRSNIVPQMNRVRDKTIRRWGRKYGR